MVYGLNLEPTQGYYVEYETLDGDMDAIRLIDDTPDEGGKPLTFGGGRPIDPTHVPTRVKWNDRKKQPMADFNGGPIRSVSARAKALIEEIEPGVHQFLPVGFVDIDGDFLEHRWFLIVCNRLDTIDRDRVRGYIMRTARNGWKRWMPVSDLVRRQEFEQIPSGYDIEQPSRMAFNLEQIGSAHLWIDKHLESGIYLSDAFDAAYRAAGLNGRKLKKRRKGAS